MQPYRFSARKLLVAALFLAAALTACDRSSQPYAGKGAAKAAGMPQYEATPSESTLAGLSTVKDVLPEGEVALDGKALFAANCSACHQIGGTGVPGAFPPLNKSPYVQSENVERMASIVLYGLQGQIHVEGNVFNNVMAPLGGVLKDDQIAAIMNYVRSAWDNSSYKGKTVTPDVPAAMRKKWGTRSFFNITELGEES